MAEALATVGVVSSIVQLVDFSAKVVHRLDEFYSKAGSIPKAFRHVKTELPLLNITLQRIKEANAASSMADVIKKTLSPVIAGCQEQITELDNILIRTLPEIDDSWRKRGKKAILSLRQDTKVESVTKILRNYTRILTFYYAATSSTLQPLIGKCLYSTVDTKVSKINRWLSAPDPSTNYQIALKQRQADTGLWLLESEQYAQWKTKIASPLCLYGIPGCGKTVLSSNVLQNVLQHCHDDPGKVTAYFFFDFTDVQKQDPELMLRSLLCQLLQQSIQISPSLDALFSSCENRQRQPSVHTLLEVMQHIMQEFPQVYVVLDALDECTRRTELLDILETMVQWQLQSLHLLVTSRRERDIENTLEGIADLQNRIYIQSELVDKDIQRYVRQRLLDDQSLHKWAKDIGIRQEIEAALMKGARGMYLSSFSSQGISVDDYHRFRWAVCQLDTLGKCRNRTMLRKSLAALPPTLDETYDRILLAISKEDSKYAVRILRWLTFSARPLLVEEVAEVVAIDTERDPVFERDEVLEDPLEALNICSSLITIITDYEGDYDDDYEGGYDDDYEDNHDDDHEDNHDDDHEDNHDNDHEDRRPRPTRQVIALAHYSVKEYLLSDRIQRGQAAQYGMENATCHDAIAKGCIGYLLQFQQLEGLSEATFKGFKLARYSAEFWIGHARESAERMEELSLIAMNLFSTESAAYLNWMRLYNPDRAWKCFQLIPELIPAPLYTAARSGLRQVVQLLLDRGADVHANRGNLGYGYALEAASRKGHKEVVQLLLDRGADINARSGSGFSNALQAASFGGHKEVAQLLLDRGADVNVRSSGFCGSAVEAASLAGHKGIVQLLFDCGADINAPSCSGYGNALQAASFRGHKEVVQLLLDRGANVNVNGGIHGNALSAASYAGHKEVVQLLLDRGADININAPTSCFYNDALWAASVKGHKDVVQLLLDRDAVVNGQSSDYSNALQAASDADNKEVVQLLVKAGANVIVPEMQ